LEHSIPIDTKHYLETQLSNPLMRIFEPILGEKAGRLRECQRYFLEADISVAGDHTRTISIVTPTVGGLMKFAVKKVTCMGCRTPLNKNKAGKCEST
jgi:DNA polymerase delta subunit 1